MIWSLILVIVLGARQKRVSLLTFLMLYLLCSLWIWFS